MPRTWCYFIALIVPMLLQIAIFYSGFVEWLWYSGRVDYFNFFNALRVQPQFVEFIGGWQLVFFTLLILSYWLGDSDDESITRQFLLLPFAYLPFTIAGDTIRHASFDVTTLFIHPFVVIPAGYVYVAIWLAFVWVMARLKLIL